MVVAGILALASAVFYGIAACCFAVFDTWWGDVALFRPQALPGAGVGEDSSFGDVAPWLSLVLFAALVSCLVVQGACLLVLVRRRKRCVVRMAVIKQTVVFHGLAIVLLAAVTLVLAQGLCLYGEMLPIRWSDSAAWGSIARDVVQSCSWVFSGMARVGEEAAARHWFVSLAATAMASSLSLMAAALFEWLMHEEEG